MEVIMLAVLFVLVWGWLNYVLDEVDIIKDVLLGEIRKIKSRDDDDMK